MAYTLKQVTIRANNNSEGMQKIDELWKDVLCGNLPILFDNNRTLQQSISPVSKYSNYESDESGNFDMSIIGVTADFFSAVEDGVSKGLYKKYDISEDTNDVSVCVKKAWMKVWDEQSSGQIKRAYTQDYESSIPPEYSQDGKAHCYLYIAVK